MKYAIEDRIRKFLGLSDAKTRVLDRRVLFVEAVYRGVKPSGPIRWLCQWCYNGIESIHCGKRKRWNTPQPLNTSDEFYQLYCCMALAARLRIEAAITQS